VVICTHVHGECHSTALGTGTILLILLALLLDVGIVGSFFVVVPNVLICCGRIRSRGRMRIETLDWSQPAEQVHLGHAYPAGRVRGIPVPEGLAGMPLLRTTLL